MPGKSSGLWSSRVCESRGTLRVALREFEVQTNLPTALIENCRTCGNMWFQGTAQTSFRCFEPSELIRATFRWFSFRDYQTRMHSWQVNGSKRDQSHKNFKNESHREFIYSLSWQNTRLMSERLDSTQQQTTAVPKAEHLTLLITLTATIPENETNERSPTWVNVMRGRSLLMTSRVQFRLS